MSNFVNSIKPENVEIMAPAGSFESLSAAVKAGTDSVYFGISQLNMRAGASCSFALSDLEKIAEICQENKVKSYLTLNTLLYDHDIKIAKKIIDEAKKSGIDAIIGFDFACVNYCNEIKMPVHISVQFSVSNYESVKFFAQFTNKIILARELNLEQIKAIYEKIVAENLLGNEGRLMEIEAFVHGALCVAQSGRCWMSLYETNLSANRGLCRQICRMKYKVTDMESGKELVIDNHYVMSAGDICTIDFLDKILDSGVQIFKIEGRGRSAEYVYTVVKTYKKALQDLQNNTYTKEKIAEYYKDLESVFNRKLSKGNYYLGKEIGEYCDVYGSKATKEKEYVAKVTHYFTKAGVMEAKMESGKIKGGDDYLFIGPTTGVLEGKITELRVDGEISKEAKKGDLITFAVSERVRINDKLYLFKNREKFQNEN